MPIRTLSWTTLPLGLTTLALLTACPGGDDTGSSAGSTSTGMEGTTVVDPTTGGQPNTSTGVATEADSSGGSTAAVDSSGGTTVDPTTGSPVVCGDGAVEGDELCDDGNTDDGDGCSATCTVDEGWECDDADPSVCATVCGDMIVGAPVEECDDGNMEDTDDCTNACLNPVCGDGITWAGNEGCDDGGTDPGDGCSDLCEVEAGFLCDGAPSVCAPGIFLADGIGGNPGNLYVMSLDGLTVDTLGPLGVAVTGMAFHPDGTLYAVTVGGGTAQLGTIDLGTVSFSPIGLLQTAGGVNHSHMPDIAFMGSQLVGWTENGDDLTMIDTATGQVTVVPTPQGSLGTALAYDSTNDDILLAPQGANDILYMVTPAGAVTAGPTLGGTNNAVKGLSYYDGLLYGLDTGWFGDPAGNVVTYNPATGAAMLVAVMPSANIDAVAVYDPMNSP